MGIGFHQQPERGISPVIHGIHGSNESKATIRSLNDRPYIIIAAKVIDQIPLHISTSIGFHQPNILIPSSLRHMGGTYSPKKYTEAEQD